MNRFPLWVILRIMAEVLNYDKIISEFFLLSGAEHCNSEKEGQVVPGSKTKLPKTYLALTYLFPLKLC